MIVRPYKLPDGEPMLFLIQQSVHAALSGDLASHWGNRPFSPLIHPEVVWPAIFHHDDGWIPVDKSPPIDPKTKRPVSFLDSPAPASHAIWTKSIEWAARISPFAQYLIAEHFMSLREHSESAESEAGQTFIHKYEELSESWRDNWEQRHPQCTDAEEKLALAQLRFFDWFSLWLCLDSRTEVYQFEQTPGDIPLTIRPVADGLFHATPWPWTVDRVHVAAGGYLVPDRDYTDTDDLLLEMNDWCRIEWQFAPE
ncbi:hypothetical protein C5Y96_08435 [Blastopirellula marina]|uniref:DUF3891 domain-containing protein n=1 Tax=Blastopirellula marina TaxID=124 RepID=A0A2S8FU17_9BACT|nr:MULTISPECIES: DUF3891 family protein [Pirellulaceae]PQO35676.1 hypothetical protein C5Y96_08435 [Blastopirellula marina]RCS53250.1 DUF3891 family protein [Bremerella cremea]